MVGSKISVAVMDADGNSDLSDETEEVGVYEALEILSAEQVKKDQVYVTFSAPISEADKITVTKGSADKTVSAVLPDDDNLGATLTMKDALATGTYTVTLTPADTKVDPSSVEFDAKVANKAARVEILGENLVMKDTSFQEGYCFIKGYNEFDEEITLSGLTVTAAPSDSTQYDASTGKLTVKSEVPNQYAIIKQVTVYAQAMVDSKPVMDQKTLEVANIGYPTEVEFGEITKDDTNAPDISEGIPINELNSGLYYIPILSVKDNYGNDMLAKDLNDLNEKNLLTTVPTGDNSLYFSVRDKGSVFTEKNGQIVVFLRGGNGKPGKFNFLMTSAGGQFDKEVNIIENPFINTLNVNLPDIYEFEETDEFGLTAYDQDGKELDLYDYLIAGEYNQRLPFVDKKNLTESSTYIDAGDTGTWRVQKFADTKEYKVTFVPKETVHSKSIITFVSTTASFKTRTLIATVGARGTSGYIGTELKTAASGTYDFNQNLRFFDANGKEMDRAHNEKYPTFVTPGKTVVATLDKDAVKKLTDEKIAEANHDNVAGNDFKFYYVVSKDDKHVETGKFESVQQIDGDDTNDGKVGPGQYYVFLIASQDLDTPAATRIIDSRAFYVSAKQDGDVPVSYTAKVSNKLYTGDKYDDDVAVTVDVTFRNGVVKTGLAATGLSLDGGFKVKDNTISKGTAKGDGTATVSVYLKEVTGEPYVDKNGKTTNIYKNDGAVATCTLTYSDDDPVGTSVTFKRETQKPDPDPDKTYGTSWKENETEKVWDLVADSVIEVKNGELTMTNGNEAKDTYHMTVEDQYGTTMKDAKYYVNGKQILKSQRTEADGSAVKVLEIKGQSKGSEVSQTWRVNVPVGTTVTSKDNTTAVVTSDITVTTVTELDNALTAAATSPLNITLGNSILNATAVTIPTDSKLIVPEGKMLTMTGALTVNGTGKLVNNGVVTLGGDSSVAATTGEITNNGTFDGGAHKLTVAGKFINNGTVKGTTGSIEGTGTYTNNEGAETTIPNGGINMSKANTLENFGTVTAKEITGYVLLGDQSVTTATNTFTPVIFVPSGTTAYIYGAGGTAAAPLVIKNDSSDAFEAKATNTTDAPTAVAGSATITTPDGKTTEPSVDAKAFDAYALTAGAGDSTDASAITSLGGSADNVGVTVTEVKDSRKVDVAKKTVTFNYVVTGELAENKTFENGLGYYDKDGYDGYIAVVNYKYPALKEGSSIVQGTNVYATPGDAGDITNSTCNTWCISTATSGGTVKSTFKPVTENDGFNGWTFIYNVTLNCTAKSAG